MRITLARIVAIVSIAWLASPAYPQVADEDTLKINKMIASYATQLDVGTISLHWFEQPEVKKVRSFTEAKRSAAILATIWSLAKNDETIFRKMKTNDYEVVVSMLTRIHAYTFLTSLAVASTNDLLLKEYLDQEVADLKQVFARNNSVAAYQQARKIRDDKQAVLLKDQKIAAELIKFRTGKETVTQSLANVTTMLSVIAACTANAELCLKMESL